MDICVFSVHAESFQCCQLSHIALLAFELWRNSHCNMLLCVLHLFNQGFRWYTRKLRIDEDGDVADEFLDEVIPESSINNGTSPVGRFQPKYNTKPASLAMRKQIIAVDGDIRHSLEHQGQLQWVWVDMQSSSTVRVGQKRAQECLHDSSFSVFGMVHLMVITRSLVPLVVVHYRIKQWRR